MRIAPLHNIREPGLIPNGFQKEKAPPPAPDHTMQPDMRHRVEPQTDTRHAVEYFNPMSRMEANAPNRTGSSHSTAVEMGRDRERVRPKEKEAGSERSSSHERDYERLLRILYGTSPRQGTALASQNSSAGAAAGVAERERPGSPTDAVPDRAAVETAPEREYEDAAAAEARQRGADDYYFRRGLEAYRQVQALAGEGSSRYEA